MKTVIIWKYLKPIKCLQRQRLAKRMESSIESGLAAPVAVEKEQSETRSRMSRLADPYIRERLHDLDDISNRLIRILTKTETDIDKTKIDNAILVARNIGPADLLDYGKRISGVLLERVQQDLTRQLLHEP